MAILVMLFLSSTTLLAQNFYDDKSFFYSAELAEMPVMLTPPPTQDGPGFWRLSASASRGGEAHRDDATLVHERLTFGKQIALMWGLELEPGAGHTEFGPQGPSGRGVTLTWIPTMNGAGSSQKSKSLSTNRL